MLILVWAVAPFFALGLAGLVYQLRAERLDRRYIPASGRFVSLRGGSGIGERLYVDNRGRGSPLVLFESGLAASSLSWGLVQSEIARYTQTVAYDRAGLGWSRFEPAKIDLASLVADLAEVLQEEAGSESAILVGHSFGGLIVRAFAARYPHRVHSLVLVDPMSPAHWSCCGPADTKRLALGAKLARRGAFLARLGVVRFCLRALISGRQGVPRLVSHVSGGRGKNLIGRLTREMSRLPREMWPALISHWSRPAGFLVMARYLDNLVGCAQDGVRLQIPRSIPVTVISAGIATATEQAERRRWVDESIDGEWIEAADSSHWIQLQCPELVVAAILRRVNRIDTART